MKIFVVRGSGIEALKIEDAPAPGPLAAGQVRIAMKAAAINFRDTLAVAGQAGGGSDGLIPCSDGAGEVVEVGPAVWRTRVGDRVALTFNPDWIGGMFPMSMGAVGRGSAVIPGTMQEEIVVHQSEVVAIPAHLSFEEGAAYTCAGLTAWHALTDMRTLMPGMTVLVQGGGGVSTLALQFAKMFGARVIATTSSAARGEQLKALGADAIVDYNADPEWNATIRTMTGGGVDIAIDIGGADTIDRTIAATKIGGLVAVVGQITGRAQAVSALASASVDVTSLRTGSRADHENIFRAVGYHQSRPSIGARYGFDELPEALRQLQTGKHFGKIVIGF